MAAKKTTERQQTGAMHHKGIDYTFLFLIMLLLLVGLVMLLSASAPLPAAA